MGTIRYIYRSEAETLMAEVLKDLKVEFKHDYRFAPPRKFMLDFALPLLKIGIEVEGITPHAGRHQRFIGYMKDCEKYNIGLSKGWRILRIPAIWLTSEKYYFYYLDFVEQLKQLIKE